MAVNLVLPRERIRPILERKKVQGKSVVAGVVPLILPCRSFKGIDDFCRNVNTCVVAWHALLVAVLIHRDQRHSRTPVLMSNIISSPKLTTGLETSGRTASSARDLLRTPVLW